MRLSVDAFRRALVGLFASVFVMACGPLNADQAKAEDITAPPPLVDLVASKSKPVALDCYTAGEKNGHGTGFYVDPLFLVSAAHVQTLPGGMGSGCAFKVGEVAVPFVFVDQAADTAIVRAPARYGGATFEMRCDYKPTLGDRVSAYGFGTNGGFIASEGHVVESTLTSKLAEVTFGIDAYVEPGMSGGPVVDDAGRVIGIITGAFPKEKPMDNARSIVVPIAAVCSQVERYRRAKDQIALLTSG